MAYERKTRDVWVIKTNYGYGWEDESVYTKDDYKSPMSSAYADAREYELAGAMVKVIRRREVIA